MAKAKRKTETDDEAQTFVAKKLNPGQYAALPRGDTLRFMEKAKTPGLKGYQIRLYWREMEPTKGAYDFSAIIAALAYCETNNLQLIVLIVDKSFTNDNPMPVYMRDFAIPNRSGGFTLARWLPTPVARMRALIRAIGARFDKHPRFEGVGLQESSPSLSDTALKLHGYTPELYRDALINVINSANTTMPNTRMFWYMNYIPDKQIYIGSIANAIAPGGHLMGGPDWLPDAYLLKDRVYPFYVQMKDKMSTFISAQYDSYRHAHRTVSQTKYWTPAELYDSAKARIFTDYFLWTWTIQRSPADSYCYTDAIPVIARDVVEVE